MEKLNYFKYCCFFATLIDMFDINKYREIQRFLAKNGCSGQIIAISKNHPLESVLVALKYGVTIFGENRVMEAKSKFLELKHRHPKIELHLTGPLQSNKVKEAVKLFDVFHTLDREKIALEFSKFSDFIKGKKIFIQVNTGEEKSKSGVLPSDLKNFVSFCKNEIKLNIHGLMCIPPIEEDPKKHFKYLQNLGEENNLAELSIGMSDDYQDAVGFNPTYLRLGTILFGKRN